MKQKQRCNSKTKISTNRINNNNKPKITKHINRTMSSSNTRTNKRIKPKQKIKIEEEKNLKASQDLNDISYSMNLFREKKINNSINRLIDTSQNLLEKQNEILKQANNLMQNIESNNHEIDKIKKKEEKLNFTKNINNYNKNLEDVLTKLKLNTKEVGLSNKMKEENNKLKYKIEMLSIDKNDDFRNIESDLNSLKNIYINEMNSMLRYLNELGFEDLSLSYNINNENLNSEVIINFFNLIKNIIKQLKLSNKEKEGQIELLKKSIIENRNEINDNNNNNDYKYFDFNNKINNNIINSNYSSLDNYKTSINNDRIKKIEELCLNHTYDIDNIKENKLVFQSNFDNFKRSKNTINNELNNNSDLGIQLEHNYTDSYFYPKVKESLSNDNNHNDYLEKNNIKEYISRINESQPMNKFI